MLNKIFQF